MADLSPAAQAVLDAYKKGGLDAALRAAADQAELLPLGAVALTIEDMVEQRIRRKFLAIATELENHQ